MISIANQNDIEQLIKTDKIFELIYKKYGSPPNWSRPQGFVSLSKIILEQQVSLASANAHFSKLSNYLLEFTPTHILELSDDEMRKCQISRQKAKYLRALSKAIIEKELNLENLPSLNEAEMRDKLYQIKGIGKWTADIYLMFCLQIKDIFPSGDIAIINTMKELTGTSSKEDIISLAEEWKPIRSLATYFLWHFYLKKRNRSVIY